MNSRWIHGLLALTFLGALVLTTGACNDDDNNVLTPPAGGGGASNLTATSSSPADGNATLTASGNLVVNNAGTGFDELNFSQNVGGVDHEVTITWDTSTHAINSAEHAWGVGTTGHGFTQCVAGTANVCDPAKVTVNFAGHTVTFTGQPLTDLYFSTGAVSTLSGTVAW